MQVLTGEGHDGCHRCDVPGAYEWWYVDVCDASGEWGAVVILFRGMPMSPDYLAAMQKGAAFPVDACGYSVSVYHRGRRIAMAFRGVDAGRCTFSDRASVDIGPASLHFAEGRLTVAVDTQDERVPQRVTLRMQLQTPWSDRSSDAPFHDQHGWVIAAPLLHGTMEVGIEHDRQSKVHQTVHVTGYHDHNMGRRPMQADFGEWHWGRVHMDNQVFVFLDTTQFSWAGMFGKHGVTAWAEVQCRVLGRRPTVMGLLSPRRLVVSEAERGGKICTVDHDTVLEDGPFYRRYRSTYRFADGVEGQGYAEYMNVRRFGDSWIRPFLRLPWLT